jgi:hypothetical protein
MTRRLAIRIAKFIVALSHEPLRPADGRPARTWRDLWAPSGTAMTVDSEAGVYRPSDGARVRVKGFVLDEVS